MSNTTNLKLSINIATNQKQFFDIIRCIGKPTLANFNLVMESTSVTEDSRLDPFIATWILEFLLRQPVPDKLINKFLFTEAFPVGLIDAKLKRMIVLRSIQSEISSGSVSEKTLDALEILEKLDRANGASASESLRLTYCAVAVDCTVKNIHRCSRSDGKADYFVAVDRIWRTRVSNRDSEEGECSLFGDEYISWRNEVEAAVFDPAVEALILRRRIENDAVTKVRDYLNEAWLALGPSFLELEAKRIEETEKEEIFDGNSANPNSQNHVEEHSNVPTKGNETEIEVDKAVKAPRKRVKLLSNHRRNAKSGSKIVNTEEEDDISPCSSEFDDMSTVELDKAKAALKFASKELHSAVKDPLPEALRTARDVAAELGALNPSDPIISSEKNEGACAASTSEARDNAPQKRSLMDRNETARVFEWEDSVEDSRERVRKGSPLKRYDVARVVRRRKVKRWSVEEEHALIEAVERFGKGNWKLILHSKRDVFSERTEVDLKDKWRNMSK